MLSFTLFSLLSGEFLRGLAEIGEELLPVDCSVRPVDISLSPMPQLDDIRPICGLVSAFMGQYGPPIVPEVSFTSTAVTSPSGQHLSATSRPRSPFLRLLRLATNKASSSSTR